MNMAFLKFVCVKCAMNNKLAALAQFQRHFNLDLQCSAGTRITRGASIMSPGVDCTFNCAWSNRVY
jgi:hypothetical protein